MDLIFASEVISETSESANYYENEVEGLGKAFLQKVEDGFSDIKESPLAYRIIRGDFRRHLLSRFPFGIIYRIDSDTIYVVAVMHLKRIPHYWLERKIK